MKVGNHSRPRLLGGGPDFLEGALIALMFAMAALAIAPGSAIALFDAARR
jgi:hypothetical protein